MSEKQLFPPVPKFTPVIWEMMSTGAKSVIEHAKDNARGGYKWSVNAQGPRGWFNVNGWKQTFEECEAAVQETLAFVAGKSDT